MRGLGREQHNEQKALALLLKRKQRIAKAKKELAEQNERRREAEIEQSGNSASSLSNEG
jgi:hypothetical protein